MARLAKARDIGLLSVSGATLIAMTPTKHATTVAVNLYVAGYRSRYAASDGAQLLVEAGRRAVLHGTALPGVPGGQLYRYTDCAFGHCGGFLFSVSKYVIQETSDCGGCEERLLDSQASAIYLALRSK